MPACAACGRDNPEGFRFCGACGAELTAPPIERRKLATLLFCDMKGSTALGERVDPEALRAVMARYFDSMRRAIERHGGLVEKFVGDAVMAVFGVPVANEDDALRAVRAAHEMQASLAELNDELEQRFGLRVAIRIGVNTGEVVTGDASARQMLVTGDAVNVAARLEQHAQPGQVLLGETTYRLVRDAVAAEVVEAIAAKGKSEPVAAYRLVGMESTSRAGPSGSPLVGRNRELAELHESVERALEERRPTLVTIVGEPGVGKSRLAGELLAGFPSSVRILEGRCLSYGEGITWWPVGEMVRRAAQIEEDDSGEQAVGRIRRIAREEVVAVRIAQAVGLLAGEARGEEIVWAIRRFLAALAADGPLVLLVDDLQWAEPPLLELFRSLPRLVADVPLVVVALARPELLETEDGWKPDVLLQPIGDEAAAQLVPRELGHIRERIVRAAGGNPLYVEELAGFLAEGGDASAVPESLSALLGARLDRLPDEERSTLEVASVEGEIFHRGALLALTDRPVEGPLERLAARDLIRAAQAELLDEAAFRFRHLLVRDAAYNATAKRVRAELHERFADWLEDKARGRLGEVEAIVGYHLERAYRYRLELGAADDAGVARRAAGHLLAAGRRAGARGDWRAAAALLGRTLALAEPTAEVLFEAGVAFGKVGRLADSARALEDAAREAHASGDRGLERLAETERVFYAVMSGGGSTEDLLSVTERAVTDLALHGDDRRLALVWARRCVALFYAGRLADAAAAAEHGLAYAERAGARHERADVLEWLMLAMTEGPASTRDLLDRFEPLLAASEDEPAVAWTALITVAQAEALRGLLPSAREKIQRGLALSAELGLEHNHLMIALQLAYVELHGGDLGRAEQALRQGLDRLLELELFGSAASIASMLADVLYRQRRLDDAERFARRAVELAHEDDFVVFVETSYTIGKVIARRGDPATGETLVRRAVERAKATDTVDVNARALLSLGEVLRLAGKPADAAEAVGAALSLLETKEDLVWAAEARTLLEELRAGAVAGVENSARSAAGKVA